MVGVSVSAREVSTNITVRTVTSDSEGNYEMPGLKAGTYQVTASISGFKTSVVDDVQLQSSQVKRVDTVLEVGEVATEVTVSAASAAIQTETATAVPEVVSLPRPIFCSRPICSEAI